MRKLFGMLAIGVFFMAGQASAAALTSATFTFQLGTLPGATFPGAGATGSATTDLSAGLGAGSAFAGATTTSIPTSAAPPLTYIQVIITKNAGGTFTGATPGNVGGNLEFDGVANVYGIGSFPGGGAPLLGVPLKIGVPNTITLLGGGVAITALSSGWTAGTAVVTGVTTTSTTMAVPNPNGSETLMGANNLTPNGAGSLVLVTPIKVATNIAGVLAAFSTLTLNYVPEPGTLLLLGAGVAGLTALGRRKS